MGLTPGTNLGPYEIVSALGAGGMGEVYRARDTELKRDVAIKILPPAFSTDPERRARFKREAQVLAALNHPNIAIIHGLEQVGDVHALVMELVDGEDLSERIARGKVPLDETLSILKQIADALQAAHEHGVVHRDLKPANIRVRGDGTVKVLDFGLAKAADSSGSVPDVSQSPTVTMSRAGMVLGTAAYMSPEQARGKPVDHRTDIWAFGCVAYEMLIGRPPFAGETATDILGAIVTRDPDWDALPGNTPIAIRRLLKRCFIKDPRDRLHAAADARLEIVEAGSNHASVDKGTPRPRTMAVVAVIAIVAALAMAWPTTRYLQSAGTPAPASPPELRLQIVTPPTTDPLSMALSPDGRRLTFVATSDGTPRLWLRPLDSVTAQPLPGTDGASYPFWSPDSESIGFFAEGKLKRIDIGGGQPQTLAITAGARGGTWNSNGVILFGVSLGIIRVPASGGEAVLATRPGSGAVQRLPQFLPDGRHFLLFSQGSGEMQGIFLGELDSPETTRIAAAETAAAYMPPGYLLYMRQGSLVAQRFDVSKNSLSGDAVTVADPVGWDGAIGVGAFSVSATGVIAYRASSPGNRQLTWFDRGGKPVGVVGAADANSLQYPVLSREGHRVLVDRTVLNNRDIFFVDLSRREPTRLTFGAPVDAAPIWAPDGSRIAFRSARNGSYNLYEKSLSLEGAETLLYESGEAKTPNDWSPDGKALLFVSQSPETANDLFILPTEKGPDGRQKPYAFVQTRFDESQGTFSPNGQWVAYQSSEGGPTQIYAQPFPGPGGKRQISNAGGASPRWARDGRELFYVAPDGKLMAVPIRLEGANLEAGTAVPLFQTRLTTAFGGTAGNIKPQYDVAADGRFLMNITTEETISPITVILNWKPPGTPR